MHFSKFRVPISFYFIYFITTIKLTYADEDGGFDSMVAGLSSLFNPENKECQFTCENGAKPRKNPSHKPTTNGCGAYGLNIPMDEWPDMKDCCDRHDKCYDTCNEKRDDCDAHFKKCSKKACKTMKEFQLLTDKEYEGCVTTTKVIEATLKLGGCQAYLDSQKKACLCSKPARGEL